MKDFRFYFETVGTYPTKVPCGSPATLFYPSFAVKPQLVNYLSPRQSRGSRLVYYKNPEKIPLKPYMDFSVIYYIKWSVVAIFSVNPMHSANPMSVKVMHHCTYQGICDELVNRVF